MVRSAYRWLRAMSVARKPPERLWREGFHEEVAFWERVLPGRVATLDDYRARADPNAPVSDPVIERLLTEIPEQIVSIIDVGSGPLTAIGKTYPGKTLRISAADPLAPEYARIMREAGLEPPVPPIACRGEDLLEHFRPESFDIAFAQNALDHCVHPQRVITNMVRLVKSGRFVVLRHKRSEGRHQNYRGLHQWNFDVEDGEFVIWRPGQETIHMERVLEGTAAVDWFMEEDGYWLLCVIRKTRR
jgi:SAM-dependent methyltransferase